MQLLCLYITLRQLYNSFLQLLLDALEKTSNLQVKDFISIQMAFIANPYSETTNRLEKIILARNDCTDSLILAYGAQCATLSDRSKDRCTKFLLNQYYHQLNNSCSNGLVHVIHSLGNTKSDATVNLLVNLLNYNDVEVSKTALYALRHHIQLPFVQSKIAELLTNLSYHEDIMDTTLQALISKAEVEQVSDQNIEIVQQLTHALQARKNKEFQQLLRNHPKLIPQSIKKADKHKRQVTNDDDLDDKALQNDNTMYPLHKNRSWSDQIGPDNINLKLECNAFYGCGSGRAFRMHGKVAAVANIFGISYTIFTAKVLNERSPSASSSHSHVYAAIGDYVLINVKAEDSFDNKIYTSPEIKLINLEHEIFVFVGMVRFYISLYAQLSVTASLQSIGSIRMGPEVTLRVEGGGSQSILVS